MSDLPRGHTVNPIADPPDPGITGPAALAVRYENPPSTMLEQTSVELPYTPVWQRTCPTCGHFQANVLGPVMNGQHLCSDGALVVWK